MSADHILAVDGDTVTPSVHAAGPWREDAQHGGAPAALMASLAEDAMVGIEGEWQLRRLSLELPRPVPMAPLRIERAVDGGRSVQRVRLRLRDAQDRVAAEALVLMQRAGDSGELPAFGAPDAVPEVPEPEQCHERVRFAGMPDRAAFHATGMEIRLAGGSDALPGPATAWFRPAMPLIAGRADSAVVRVCASADFCNGLSWETPFDRFVFANSDLTVLLNRPPAGEWTGSAARTRIEPGGFGLSSATLFDRDGVVGYAFQNLLVFPRA